MKRPSPALVISCVALFASLGGTGYAATQIHSGATAAKAKAKKAAKPITKSEVNKLIASYIKAHHIGAVGPQGPQGGPGVEGKTGPQGPGAQRIAVAIRGGETPVDVAVGPWTVKISCTPSSGEYEINGPGSMFYTSSFGSNNSSGASITTGHGSFGGGGYKIGIGTGHQSSIQGFLINGSTIEQISLEVSADNGGLFESCEANGDAIPVP